MNNSTLQIRETDSGLEIRIYVQPRAKRSEVSGVHDGALKIKVTAPPVEDAANRAVMEFMASLLHIPKSKLRILSGSRSRQKTLLAEGVSSDTFRKCLGKFLSLLPGFEQQ
jgi:uncharacterized protein (TIGR00251 family)